MTASSPRDEVDEARSLLAELVAIPSPSGAEGRIAERIEELSDEWGLACRRVAGETGRDSLLVGPSNPTLLIAAHLDTIDAPWRAEARVDGDIVHGLGAVDDKAGVVACLLAARELEADSQGLDELGVAFGFPVDEERDGDGSRTLALELRPRYAVALEATGLKTGVAEAGDVEALVHVEGRAAHGSRPDLGENAINRALELINALPELELGRYQHALLGRATAEIRSIAAGTDHNAIPDRCTFKLGLKVVPGQSSGETVAALEELAARYSAHVELIEVTEAIATPADSRIVRELDAACRSAVGRGSEPIGVPAWTDAHNFHRFGGAEVVVFGPGQFETAHTPEEHVDVREVVDCVSVFVALARGGWR